LAPNGTAEGNAAWCESGTVVAEMRCMRRSARVCLGISLFGLSPALVLAMGCMLPVAYEVAQSSTIPLPTPTPPPSSRGMGDLYLGASTLTVAEPSSEAATSGSSLYVPRTQLEGALSFHHSLFGVRALGGVALGEGPSVASTPLPRASEAPGFAGVGFDLGFFDENERFSAMLTLEGLFGFATSVQRATPIYADGSRGPTGMISGVDLEGIFGLQASAGYWVADWCRLMGGVGFRTSPSNRASFVAEAHNDLLVSDPPSGVVLGDVVGLLWAGAEFRVPFSETVGGALVPSVSWPFAGGPVTYGPIVTLGLRLTFGTLRGSSIASETPE
jgi:hypothetical protein